MMQGVNTIPRVFVHNISYWTANYLSSIYLLFTHIVRYEKIVLLVAKENANVNKINIHKNVNKREITQNY